jgi:hypothetical protein
MIRWWLAQGSHQTIFGHLGMSPRGIADALRIFSAPYVDSLGMLKDWAMPGKYRFPSRDMFYEYPYFREYLSSGGVSHCF